MEEGIEAATARADGLEAAGELEACVSGEVKGILWWGIDGGGGVAFGGIAGLWGVVLGVVVFSDAGGPVKRCGGGAAVFRFWLEPVEFVGVLVVALGCSGAWGGPVPGGCGAGGGAKGPVQQGGFIAEAGAVLLFAGEGERVF